MPQHDRNRQPDFDHQLPYCRLPTDVYLFRKRLLNGARQGRTYFSRNGDWDAGRIGDDKGIYCQEWRSRASRRLDHSPSGRRTDEGPGAISRNPLSTTMYFIVLERGLPRVVRNAVYRTRGAITYRNHLTASVCGV